jgi:outer membrane receptor protein involved in Fe transport
MYSRTLQTLAALLIAIGCVAMPAAMAAAPASAVVAQVAGSVSGTVTDTTGAPISGAAVMMTGPTSYSTTTDANGHFAIDTVTQGVYTISVSKAGYYRAVQSIAVVAGQPQNLTVSMGAITFSSLRTIAHVQANGRGAINTSAASVNVITPQEFVNQAAPQVTRVLNQIPGLQISFPSNSANAAAPGAITVPNLRDAESYETATLIDGHYISVGQYGDNVTTFLNTFMFGNIEVVKGPGADSPEDNNAIGGTLNFHTKDPTLTATPDVLVGLDNHGGTFTNFGISDTIFDGRLGFVVDVATDNNPSAINGLRVYYDPSGGSHNGALGTGTLEGNPGYTQVPHTLSFLPTQYHLLACCYTLQGYLQQNAELIKLRYRLSPATVATVSYLGSQSWSDQNANTSDYIDGVFAPGGGYTGSLQPGPIQVANVFPGTFSGEFNNEPIFQAEVSTTLGNDSFIARYYGASIERYQFQGGTSPFNLDYNNVTLYGSSSTVYPNPFPPPATVTVPETYNGTGASVGYADFYQEPEIDKLTGESFEWQHPFANNDMLTFSVDQTHAQSTDYSVFYGPFYSYGLPPGTEQLYTTYLLRLHAYITPKLDATLSNYYNTYSSTFATMCPPYDPFCTDRSTVENGTGLTFSTVKNTHYDPRVALVYRPTLNSSVRLSAGGAIAPPFMGLLSSITTAPSYNGQVAIESQSNGNLKPETAFGYDLGADYRLGDGLTVVSADGYLTNLFNRFFGQTINTGLTCGPANPCTGGAPVGTPILNSTNTNISNARFEGVELSIKRNPVVGFGFNLSGAIMRGYFYNLPPGFYCSVPTKACINNPTQWDQNLNIIAGQNTNGITDGFYAISYNGNMRIPYSQGNAELWYSFPNRAYLMFGETYYGNNNSLNERAFTIGYTTLRYPIGKRLAIEVSGDNIFNKYSGLLPVLGAGVPIPLANGWTGATTGNVLGPATWRLVLTTTLPQSLQP